MGLDKFKRLKKLQNKEKVYMVILKFSNRLKLNVKLDTWSVNFKTEQYNLIHTQIVNLDQTDLWARSDFLSL